MTVRWRCHAWRAHWRPTQQLVQAGRVISRCGSGRCCRHTDVHVHVELILFLLQLILLHRIIVRLKLQECKPERRHGQRSQIEGGISRLLTWEDHRLDLVSHVIKSEPQRFICAQAPGHLFQI